MDKTRTAAQIHNHVMYIGKPCRNGHGGIRYTKCNRCVECMSKRYKRIKQATPPWVTPFEKRWMRDMYQVAITISDKSKIKHSVDHFYPLFGKTVSGLHTISNLRIITHRENMEKKNKHPDDYMDRL